MSTVHDAVALLRARGFALCKPDPCEKKPTYKGWPTFSKEADDFGAGDMLGIIGGPLSDGGKPGHALVIIDLDSPEAVVAADDYLPETGMMEGRAGKPRSHRYYLAAFDSIPDWARSAAEQGAAAAKKATGHPGPFTKSFRHRETDGEVLKFIGTGAQCVCPPSVWASEDGTRTEGREWEGGTPGEPAVVSFLDLWDAVVRLASWCWAKTTPIHPTVFTVQAKAAPTVLERAEKYLAKIPGAVAKQGGHNQLFTAARALRWGFDLSAEDTLKLLSNGYNSRCVPPWSEKELAHKVEDAGNAPSKYKQGYLRDAPPPAGVRDTSDGTDEPESNCRDSGDGVQEKSSPGWGPPAALPEMPPAVPFPLATFPAKLADYWQAAAESLHVPVDYVAVPALPLLGAAIGRSHAASVKRTYSEPPLLWAVVVALPGRAKSPALRMAKGPLSAHTRKWREKHREKLATNEAEFGKYEADFAKWKKNPEGDAPTKPDKPALKQLVIDKFTVESLVRINADNPRGVVLAQDELAALVNGLGQYKGGKGDDKQTMLSIWAGAEAEVNRVKDKEGSGLPLYIAHSFVGVGGMIQPDLLPLLRGDFSRPHVEFVNDGWADRFLLSYPEPMPLVGETWATISEELEKGYAEVFDFLLAMEMTTDVEVGGGSTSRPFYLSFTAGAQIAWQEFTDGIAAQANALDQTDNYIGALSKLKHYGLRLTTLVHCLRAACGEIKDGSPVDEKTVRRAAELVAYFEAHGRRCLGVGFADRPTRIANRLLAWLSRNPGRKNFTRTEAFLALKDRKDVRSSDTLGAAFRLLTDFNYLQPLKHPENMRPGPVPETYLVNTEWDRVSAKPIPTVPTVERATDKPPSNSRDSRDGFEEKRGATVPGDDRRPDPEADPEALERWAIENEDNALFPSARDTPPD